MDEETRAAMTRLRLKLKAGRGLVRDLLHELNEVEAHIQRLESQSPKEAERESEVEEILYERCVA